MSNSVANTRNVILTIMTATLMFTTIVPFLSTFFFIILCSLITLVGLLSNTSIISSKPFVYMLVFVLVEVLYAFVGKGFVLNMVIYYAAYYFASLAICYNFKFLTHNQTRFLFILMLGLFMFTFIMTFLALQTDNMIIRNYGYGNDSSNIEISMFGIYSYGVGEGLAIVLPALTAYALGLKKRFLQILVIATVLLGLLTQFIASLTTSAILSFVFSLMVVLNSLVTNRKRLGIITALVLIVLTAVFFIPSTRIGENITFMLKMEDINQSYSSGHAVGQVAGRTTLYKQSVRAVMHNPILGLGETPIEYGEYQENTVSLHTSFFDYWGLYGMFIILFGLSWSGLIKKTQTFLSDKSVSLYRWAIVSLALLLLLKGPVTIGINFLFSTVFLAILYLSETSAGAN